MVEWQDVYLHPKEVKQVSYVSQGRRLNTFLDLLVDILLVVLSQGSRYRCSRKIEHVDEYAT